MVKIKPSHNKNDTFEVRKWRDSVTAKIAQLSQELEDLAASLGVSDEAFGVSWNGNTTNAASKNALYDKIAAQDTTISGKENSITAGTTAQYWRGDKSWQTLNKSAVGLGNVDNTSDATKNSATATLTNKTISGSNNTLSNIPNSALSTNPLDRANHTGAQAISTVTNLQNELNTRFKILGKGTPLLEVYTDVFEEVISFQLPAEFMDEDGNVVILEMFMSWAEDSAHEIEIRLQDESANDEQIGLYVSETTPGESFLGRVTVTFISLAGSLLIGIVEVNGFINGATPYSSVALAFALDGSPFDLSDLLTIQVNMRVPDNLSSIQSIYALASTKMELG
jgi:hypothetical protein